MTKLAKKFSTKENDFIIERLGMMEDSVLKSNLDFQDRLIDNFKFGKYPMLEPIQYDGKIVALKYDINKDKFRFMDGKTPTGILNFVIFKENGEHKLLIGREHSFLSKGNNVEYAGTLTLNNKGKLKEIDNNSGHYKPKWTDEKGKQLTIKVFQEKFGLNITDKFIKCNDCN